MTTVELQGGVRAPWLSCPQCQYLVDGVQCPHGCKVLCRLFWSFLADCLRSKQIETLNTFASQELWMWTVSFRRYWICPYSKMKLKLTSSSSGSLVTRCMGRMRKESMGRPLHSLLISICFRVSLKALLLDLREAKRYTFSSFGHVNWRNTSSPPVAFLLTAAFAASSAGRSRWSSS